MTCLGARWGWVFDTTLRSLHLREWPGTHCIGGWVSPRAAMDGSVKPRPSPRPDPQTVQPVAGRYTDRLLRPIKFVNTFQNIINFIPHTKISPYLNNRFTVGHYRDSVSAYVRNRYVLHVSFRFVSFHFIHFTFHWSYTDIELVMYTFSILNEASIH
jgi:hypothetical protein